MNQINSCPSSSPIRVHFSDVTNKKNIIDDDQRWKLPNGKFKKIEYLFIWKIF
jgi:hypothetical protein